MTYRRKDPGTRNVMSLAKTTGSALTEGQLVKKDGTNNSVTGFTAGSALLGIAMQSVASASAGPIDIDVFDHAVWMQADVGSGTPASGDLKSCDTASGALTAAVGTDSSHDFLYKYTGSATLVDVLPHKLEANTAA